MELLQAYNALRRRFVRREDLPYIHMQSGAKFVHQWPLAEDVVLEDIAHNLSKICRYCGSIEGDDTIYSVAEHCVRASYIRPWRCPLEKLMHDGAETYTQDMPRPLKYSPFMKSVYRYYEHEAERVVVERFQLDTYPHILREVKAVDKIMLVTEKRDLFAQDRVMYLNKMDDADGVKPLPEKIVPWSPEQAKRAFITRFYELTGVLTYYNRQIKLGDRDAYYAVYNADIRKNT